MQEDQGSDVAGEAEQLSHDHQPVPRLDRQCHHQQLGEDQGREGNGNNVHKFGFKEEERSIHDDATCKGMELLQSNTRLSSKTHS